MSQQEHTFNFKGKTNSSQQNHDSPKSKLKKNGESFHWLKFKGKTGNRMVYTDTNLAHRHCNSAELLHYSGLLSVKQSLANSNAITYMQIFLTDGGIFYLLGVSSIYCHCWELIPQTKGVNRAHTWINVGNERAHAYRMVAWLYFGQIKKPPGNMRSSILSLAQTFTSRVPERLLSTNQGT